MTRQRYIRRIFLLPAACLPALFLAFFSCKLQNKIVLEGTGQGSMELSMELPSYMLDSMDIIAASIPGGDELLKAENIAAELQRTKNIFDVQVESAQKGAYHIRFRFRNFEKPSSTASSTPVQEFLSWEEGPNGSTKLSITVNRKSYRELERRFPALRDNTLLQFYGPASTEGMSRTDYLDMVEYSFGPQARSDLPGAEAVILVQLPGVLLSQTGGTVKGKNAVEFRLNLLDFALLKQEKHYSIVYR